jgi:hypothetical protein
MRERPLNRRSLLLGAAALGGAVAGGSRIAAALSIETIPPQSALGLAIANHCSEDAAHAQIRAELEAELAKRSPESGRSISLTEYCPFCGCPIVVTREAK